MTGVICLFYHRLYRDMPFTLKRNEILKQKNYFQLAFSQGRRFHGRYLQLILLPYSKRLVGFTVTRKCRRAWQRNRIKRILREIYRKNKSDLPLSILIVYAKSSFEINYHLLEEDFIKITKRLQNVD